MTELEHGQRAIDPRERFFFPENFEQVIKARAGVASGNRETGRMDNRAQLHAKLFRGRFHRSFNFTRRKIFDSAKRFTDGLQPSLVFSRKIFGDAFWSVNDSIREVETAVGRQFIKSIDLAFAGLERSPNVIVRKILQLYPACAQSIPGQLLKSVIG